MTRVDELLGEMTLPEKVAQLGAVWMTSLCDDTGFDAAKATAALEHGTGQVTRISAESGLRPPETAKLANDIQRHLVESTRLGIPAIIHEESTAGFCARDATQFPQAIGLASTWDPDLIADVAEVIRDQMLAVGARQTLAPVLDITRDPRWGRTEETYGEDPYLASRMGVAYVAGVQGSDLRRGVAATGKHFLGYGMSEGGLNHAPVHVGPRVLREVAAAPFRAAINEAGLASVMNAYNSVDGLPCGGSKEILTDLLREELGFDGLVVADYFTTQLLISHHRAAADLGGAGALALTAGLDVELPNITCYGAPLLGLVERGAVDVALVDRSVRRVLELKERLGLFDQPYVDEASAAAVFDRPNDRAIARRAADHSMVLLANDGILPLAKDVASVAVIGPAADDIRLHLGDYGYPSHPEITWKVEVGGGGGILPTADGALKAGPYFNEMTTILDAIRAGAGAGTVVVHERGCDVTGADTAGIAAAAAAAAGAAVAVVCVGGRSGLTTDCTSGEFNDASDLGLPGVQQQLVEAVVAANPRTVVVLVSGRVHAVPWIAEHAAALLQAWIPGEEGGPAVAAALLGHTNPAGRLPISMPHDVGQVPVYAGHKAGGGRSQMRGPYVDGPTTPLFPFGHGLSYTTFEYGDLEVSPLETDAAFSVSCTVTNTGERAGDEVVQLYLCDLVAPVARPVKQLAGFVRAPFGPEQSRRITFTVDPGQLAFHDGAMRCVVEPGTVKVMVGASSADIRLDAVVTMHGETRDYDLNQLAPTRTHLG